MKNYLVRVLNKFKFTMLMTLLVILSMGYPVIVTLLNNPTEKDNLDKVTGTIFYINNKEPNKPGIVIKLNNGSYDYLYFPSIYNGPVYGFSKSTYILKKDEDSLNGCVASVEFDTMKFVIFKNIKRAWEIQCKSRPLLYEDVVKKYNSNKKASFYLTALFSLLLIPLPVMFFMTERKEK